MPSNYTPNYRLNQWAADGCASFVSNRLHSCGGLAYPGQSIAKTGRTGLEITENGFRVYCDYSNEVLCNAEENFRYIAFV